jgi:hypothetical protein
LLIGIGLPAVGIAAAAGIVPFFIAAIIHSFGRTRLLVWPGNRGPSPGNRRARLAAGCVVKNRHPNAPRFDSTVGGLEVRHLACLGRQASSVLCN